MASKKLFQQLSHDLSKLYIDVNFCDVTIEIGKPPNVKSLRAHSAILYYRSPYFRREMSKPDFNNLFKKFKINVAMEIIEPLIKYIYNGTISLDDKNASEIFKTLSAADKLCLNELVIYLQKYLLDHHIEWLRRHFDSVCRMSFRNDTFQDLQHYCTEVMSKNPEMMIFCNNNNNNNTKTIDFNEQAMVSLLERNDFRMEEIQIWENLIKWGISQNKKLSSIPLSAWSNDEFIILRSILQRCLPLIRFHDMSYQQFFEKVQPFDKLFDKQIYEDLIKYFTLLSTTSSTTTIENTFLSSSNRDLIIDSTLITEKHKALISIWIRQSPSPTNTTTTINTSVKTITTPHNSYNSQNSHTSHTPHTLYTTSFSSGTDDNLYEFKLLLRGSRDGFSPSTFHKLCDNKMNTVVIFKIKGTGELLGGYNPIKWKSIRGWGQTSNSFIFSLEGGGEGRNGGNNYYYNYSNNNNRLKNAIISRVKRKCAALNYEEYLGPSFGFDDITIRGEDFSGDMKCYSSNNCYDKPIREIEGFFSLEEYEVFQIQKKNVYY
ncbi:hypothetical protein Glove_209g56 [Diversispora epigaea]|uniref:BTB domain-containing protein n=1 Tax=Diversispora epigaea TaxID=1348612 RepID=A0A397INF1_9GLOM|nr:hypothetical protein Glove_209g56 [Diversispora epigaea]